MKGFYYLLNTIDKVIEMWKKLVENTSIHKKKCVYQ